MTPPIPPTVTALRHADHPCGALAAAAMLMLCSSLGAGAQSEERIADTYRSFPGGYPGASLAVFESVLNESRLQNFDFASLRYYVAPQFVLQAASPLRPISTPEGRLLYGFNLIAYDNNARSDAAANLSQTISDPRNGQLVEIRSGSVYHLPHQMVAFRVLGFPEALVRSIGNNLDENVAYQPTDRLTVEIPADRQEYLEDLIRSGNLQVEAVLTYNARSITRVQLQVTTANILNAARRRVFQGGGAAFFTADDLEAILREAVTSSQVNILIDPQADGDLVAWVRDFFATLTVQNFATTAESAEDARNLEARLWQGPGIQPADFQPITLIWNVARDLSQERDYHSANESVRQYYRENRTHFEVSFKAGYGPFSATVRQGFERVSRDEEFFRNQEELQEFQRENYSESGQEPRITARGLDLISSRELETRASSLSRVVAVKPTAQINRVTVQCLVEYDGSDSTDTLRLSNLHRRLKALELTRPRYLWTTVYWNWHPDLAMMIDPQAPVRSLRPLAGELPGELRDRAVMEARTEIRPGGGREIHLRVAWKAPFPLGSQVAAFASLSHMDIDEQANIRVAVRVADADHRGATVIIESWSDSIIYGIGLQVVGFGQTGDEFAGDLLALDEAAAMIRASAGSQEQFGLFAEDAAASRFIESPRLLNQYGFKDRVAQLIRSNASEMHAVGLYPESSIRNLYAGVPLMEVNPSTGQATIALELESSDTMQPGSWTPVGEPAVWVEPVRPDQAFFRVFLDSPTSPGLR